MKNDLELLQCYVNERSEAAFTELVQRHLPLVYCVALRRVGGDAHLAEDVAQKVFLDFDRKAPSLLGRTTLSSWLYVSAQVSSAALVRSERRRKVRELEAHSMQINTLSAGENDSSIRPLLDEAMVALKEDDRAALLLRFFEKRSFAELAAELRLTEDAARKRVDRALEKLRTRLAKRGITSTAGAISLALGSEILVGNAIVSTLGPRIVQQALAQSGPAGALVSALVLFKALAPASGVLLVGGFLIWAQREQTYALESEIVGLRRANQAAATLSEENARVAQEIAALETARARTPLSTPSAPPAQAARTTAVPASAFRASIVLTREGSLRWNNQPVSLKEFLAHLKSIEGRTPHEIPRLALQVDPGASESAVRYVFEEVIKAGPTNLQIQKVDPPVDDWF